MGTQVVSESVQNETSYQLDLSDLSVGTYVIKVTNLNDNSSQVKKITIAK